MKLENIKVGMKVKLLGKHDYGSDYDNIEEWYSDIEKYDYEDVCNIKKQGYGVVKRVVREDAVEIADDINNYEHWIFTAKDLEPYEEDEFLFKVGDKVRVKDVEVNSTSSTGIFFTSYMKDFIGKCYTIEKRETRFSYPHGRYYNLEGDNELWSFAEEWLELVEDNKTPKEWLLTPMVTFTSRNGFKCITLGNGTSYMIETGEVWDNELDENYDEDLKCLNISDDRFDIMSITYDGKVVWEREEEEKKRMAEVIRMYRTNPSKFIEDYLGVKLIDWQKEIISKIK